MKTSLRACKYMNWAMIALAVGLLGGPIASAATTKNQAAVDSTSASQAVQASGSTTDNESSSEAVKTTEMTETGTVTVRYVDTAGKVFKPATTQTGTVGSAYAVSAVANIYIGDQAYQYVGLAASSAPLSGTYLSAGQVVTLQYEAAVQETTVTHPSDLPKNQPSVSQQAAATRTSSAAKASTTTKAPILPQTSETQQWGMVAIGLAIVSVQFGIVLKQRH